MQHNSQYGDNYPPQPYHHGISGSHVSLGGIKYAIGLMATAKLAERFKAPEEKYLIMAVIGGAIGVLETMWNDYRRSREKAERDAEREQERQCWRGRVEREREGRQER